jgi:hypothetical protein
LYLAFLLNIYSLKIDDFTEPEDQEDIAVLRVIPNAEKFMSEHILSGYLGEKLYERYHEAFSKSISEKYRDIHE